MPKLFTGLEKVYGLSTCSFEKLKILSQIYPRAKTQFSQELTENSWVKSSSFWVAFDAGRVSKINRKISLLILYQQNFRYTNMRLLFSPPSKSWKHE